MRILHIITAFHLGGAEEIAINIAVGMAKRGHQCCVVALTTPREQDATGNAQKRRLSTAGVQCVEFGGSHIRLNSLTGPFRLARFCRTWRPDIVHSHTDVPDFTVSLAGRLTRFYIARTIHNTVLWPTHRILGRISESGFHDDLVVFVSDGARKAYRNLREKYNLGQSSHQLRIVNGVPPADASGCKDRPALLREFGVVDGKVLFCFAGRFTDQKGFDVLLDALNKLPESYLFKFELHAFGQGEKQELYAKQVAQARLPVTFHPPVAGISRLFPAFDAIIMPSRFEGLPLVSIESLASGVPVIGTSAPGLVETFPPDWPLIAAPEDAATLCHIIMKFLDGDFDNAQLREIGIRWHGENFSIDQMVSAYEQAYRDYLSLSAGQ